MSDLATAIAIAYVWSQPERWATLASAVQSWREAQRERDEHLRTCGRDEYTNMLHQAVEDHRRGILSLRDEFWIVENYLQQHPRLNMPSALPAVSWLKYEPGREETHANQMRVVYDGLLARKAEAMSAGGRENPPMVTKAARKNRDCKKAGSKDTGTRESNAFDKLIAALNAHHRYDSGDLNLEPIGCRALAKTAQVSVSRCSDFFKKEFKGYKAYQRACHDPKTLDLILRILNKDVPPHVIL